MGIIKSILDNDLYKFTMQCAVFILFPSMVVKYKFTDRRELSFPTGFKDLLVNEINKLSSLKLRGSEEEFLRKKLNNFLPPTYIDFLCGYRFDPSEVRVTQDENNKLHIDIEGLWYRTILWEVVLMSIISELYFISTNQSVDLSQFNESDKHKGGLLSTHGVNFADFGTRRRYSFENQKRVVGIMKDFNTFVGTSNVYLAYKYDIKPIGTHAHEWFMAHAAIYGYKMSTTIALENWVRVFRGMLGIALTDTLTTGIFWKSFDTMFAKLFDGVRHDSNDPIIFGNNAIKHYNSLGIDPLSKTIVFSDALDHHKSIDIKKYFDGLICTSFGIGTKLTNDVGVEPLNMVIKLRSVLVNGVWEECIKLSDDAVKHTGEESEVQLAKTILKL